MSGSVAENRSENHLLLLVLTVVCTLASTAALCYLISRFPVDIPSREELSRIIFLPLDEVKPEPMERRMFLASVVTLPVIIFFWNQVWSRVLGRLSDRVRHRLFISSVVAGLIAAAAYGWSLRSGMEFFTAGKVSGAEWYVGAFAIAAGLGYLLWHDRRRALRGVNVLLAVTAGILLSTIILYGLSTPATVSDSYVFTNHFNVIFHAVVQVFFGKELLADFVHQYGLYPHFLEPVFRLTGLGILSFTVIMVGLTGLSFLFILRTLVRITENRTVALLGFIGLLAFCYLFKIMSAYDPYFQYFPIRTVFPALGMWLISGYLAMRSRKGFVALFIVSGAAVLWNPETGIVLLIALLLTVMYDELSRTGIKGCAVCAVKGIGIFAATIAGFNAYMYLRYGSFPDFAELARYIRLFYGTGFFMLPMPALHPWNITVLIYTAGLAWGISALCRGAATVRTTMATFLSLLGIGLFAYYQGRSHNEVFVLCSYPAVMLLTLYIDRLVESGRENRVILSAGLCGIGLLVVISFTLFNGMQHMLQGPFSIVKRYEKFRKGDRGKVLPRAEFVRDNTTRGEQVLILSVHSGIYHLVSETANPVGVASIMETVLVDDYRKILRYLTEGNCRKLFVDYWLLSESEPEKELREILTSQYNPALLSKDMTVVMFVRKQ